MGSICWERRVQDEGSIRVMWSTVLLGGWKMDFRLSSMARIMMDIGMVNYLSSRWVNCTDLRPQLIPNFGAQIKERIIPAFEEALGPGYQALIIVDNSQGHSTYTKDALVATHMNVNPSGKQPKMHDTWFIQDGQKITQTMVYPPSHPQYPNMPKGIRAVLTEWGLYWSDLHGKCDKKCVSEDCCNKWILENQPDFQAQKLLVQEAIEAAGHLCLILPKFYCELNFFEFFWGVVKKYLCDNCDYTFDTLKENMPKALESVSVHTIQCWEHHMFCWMEAYCSGLGTTEAQQQVEIFSSTTYQSHRQVPTLHDWWSCNHWLSHLFSYSSDQ